MIVTKRIKSISGWREIGGKRVFFRSKLEMNYARYLQYLKDQGKIVDWEYEPDKFWFDGIKSGVRCYVPDFKIHRVGGGHHYDEVKGYMDKKSATKLKRMKKYHPKETVCLIDQKWFKSNKGIGYLIKGWE